MLSPLSSTCVSAASNKNRDVRVAAPVFQNGASITVVRGLVAQRLSPIWSRWFIKLSSSLSYPAGSILAWDHREQRHRAVDCVQYFMKGETVNETINKTVKYLRLVQLKYGYLVTMEQVNEFFFLTFK